MTFGIPCISLKLLMIKEKKNQEFFRLLALFSWHNFCSIFSGQLTSRRTCNGAMSLCPSQAYAWEFFCAKKERVTEGFNAPGTLFFYSRQEGIGSWNFSS